jgi:ATP-dependent Lon protease
VGDLRARRRQLIAEFPWAVEVVDFVLGDLVNRQTVTIRPVLLTGTPGSGKTHFARRFAHVFGLHLWSVDCGGADGSVFSGTDRRWHSAEPSHPFLAMSRGRQANPLMVLDEIEKAPTRQDYGRLWDSLLPFLEPGSNGQVQDRCLQVPIDASHVNYIATANRIETLPWPLRDRFRITQFPEPTAEHLPALVAPLLAQLAEARGLDGRFIAHLDLEEQAFLARRWRGGSVRGLARLIEAIVNARERAMSQH